MSAFLDSDSDSLALSRRHFYESLPFPLLLSAVLWLVHIYIEVFGIDPGIYGIMSQRMWGLRGIVTAPLVHGSWGHLISNTFPLLLLLVMALYFYRKVAMRAFWMIYFLTGITVWLFARPVSHIGASGVVYGLVAFIFWNGIFRRSFRSIILAGIVVLLYSGMFMGILPQQEGISWESHLLGSLAGIFASFWYKGELEDEESEKSRNPFAEERLLEKEYFLPRDIFAKTKAQRREEAEAEARMLAERLAQQQQQQYPGPQNVPPFWNQSSTWGF